MLHLVSLNVQMPETETFPTLHFFMETVPLDVPSVPVPAVHQVESSVLLHSLNYTIFLLPPPPQTTLCLESMWSHRDLNWISSILTLRKYLEFTKQAWSFNPLCDVKKERLTPGPL